MLILAGDIGGTNSRLALFELAAGRFLKRADERLPSRAAGSLQEVVAQFLNGHKARPQAACFGLPGPVKQERVVTTNLPWTVEAAQLREQLGVEGVFLLNDLESYAWGVAALEPDDFAELHAGAPDACGNRAVIAAGTGLGQAGLYWDGKRHHAFPTEGGHTDFAPRNDLQFDLHRHLKQRFGCVSWERVLSGPGLVNVYEYLREVGGGTRPSLAAAELEGPDPAAAITTAALARTCPIAEQTLDLFVEFYGIEAGNLALKHLSSGGLFLGGGIAPKILPKLREGAFLQAFFDKDRMREVLEAIPVRVIVNEDCGLLGAARHTAVRVGAVAG